MLTVLNVLNELKMFKDPSLACWALFYILSFIERDIFEKMLKDVFEKDKTIKKEIVIKFMR